MGDAGRYGIAAALIAAVMFFVCMPFWPVIQGFTNSTSWVSSNLTRLGWGDTPLVPIVNLWWLWAVLLTLFGMIFVIVIARKG